MRLPLALILLAATTTHAASFGTRTVSYTPGAGVFFLNNPTAALGKPAAIVPGFPAGEFMGIPFSQTPAEPVNPFVIHFGGDQLTQIGAGGELVIELERFVELGAGLELAVFGNVFLTNTDTSGDTANRTAAADATAAGASFGVDAVKIEVSATGLPGSWAPINSGQRVAIDDPINYFANATGLQSPDDTAAALEALPAFAALVDADFGKPYDNPAGLSAYNGKTIAEIETLLDGSAGGDWFDLSGLVVDGDPLERVGYVRFFDPAETFELLAVSINRDLSGARVPEPGALVIALVSVLFAFNRRGRR